MFFSRTLKLLRAKKMFLNTFELANFLRIEKTKNNSIRVLTKSETRSQTEKYL